MNSQTKNAWLFALMLTTIAACSTSRTVQPPPSTQNPPLYPGAQQVVVQDLPGGSMPQRQIRFVTTDNPEHVLQFYKDSLVIDGWFFRDDISSPEASYFGWLGGSANEPAYTMAIFVELTEGAQTNVEVHLVTTLPH
jgi:hypothetical protein